MLNKKNVSIESYSPSVVMITGASSGIGRAIAQMFDSPDRHLILCGRDQVRLDSLKQELSGQVTLLNFDMQDKLSIQKACQQLKEKGLLDQLDLLVNNAGLALGLDYFYEADLDDLETMIDTNVKGLVALTRHITPFMVQRKRGHIINIGSIAGNFPYTKGHVYCATKAFVKQFSMALKGDLYQHNVRVTDIEPGIVKTNFLNVRFKGDEEKLALYQKLLTQYESLNAPDIARTVHFVATLPEHCNVSHMEIVPTQQPYGFMSAYDMSQLQK